MAGLTYEQSKKNVYKGLVILAVVTLVEVFFSLLGKGHLMHFEPQTQHTVYLISSLIIIALSLYKAYYILFEFMHLRYENKALARTVLIPTGLLLWALIAFLMEGQYWKDSNSYVKEQDRLESPESVRPVGVEPGDILPAEQTQPIDSHQ